MTAIYEFRDVGKRFSGPENLEIFRNISFTVEQGESLAIVGTSGSGKSTLLHLLGALDTPTEGAVLFDGRDLAALSPDETARFRNTALGFVFQFHHLLPEFSAEENVAMPALIGGARLKDALPEARDMLERVGLAHRMGNSGSTLSGGERQRVAIARAALPRPRVLLADEPTGNLDESTGAHVGELMARLNADLGMTLVVVTHNQELAASMGRALELRAGTLYEKTYA